MTKDNKPEYMVAKIRKETHKQMSIEKAHTEQSIMQLIEIAWNLYMDIKGSYKELQIMAIEENMSLKDLVKVMIKNYKAKSK